MLSSFPFLVSNSILSHSRASSIFSHSPFLNLVVAFSSSISLSLSFFRRFFLFHALVSIFMSSFRTLLSSFLFSSFRLIPLLPSSAPYSLFSPPLQLASPHFLAYVLSLPLPSRFLSPILSHLPFPSLHLFVSLPLSIYFVSIYCHRPFFSAPASSILLSLSLNLPNSPVRLFRSCPLFLYSLTLYINSLISLSLSSRSSLSHSVLSQNPHYFYRPLSHSISSSLFIISLSLSYSF